MSNDNDELFNKSKKSEGDVNSSIWGVISGFWGGIQGFSASGKESLGEAIDAKTQGFTDTFGKPNLYGAIVMFFILLFLIVSTILTFFIIIGSIIAVSLSSKINKDLTGFPRTVKLMKAFAMNWWYVFYGFIYLSRQRAEQPKDATS